jgi:hypothetical protein
MLMIMLWDKLRRLMIQASQQPPQFVSLSAVHVDTRRTVST